MGNQCCASSSSPSDVEVRRGRTSGKATTIAPVDAAQTPGPGTPGSTSAVSAPSVIQNLPPLRAYFGTPISTVCNYEAVQWHLGPPREGRHSSPIGGNRADGHSSPRHEVPMLVTALCSLCYSFRNLRLEAMDRSSPQTVRWVDQAVVETEAALKAALKTVTKAETLPSMLQRIAPSATAVSLVLHCYLARLPSPLLPTVTTEALESVLHAAGDRTPTASDVAHVEAIWEELEASHPCESTTLAAIGAAFRSCASEGQSKDRGLLWQSLAVDLLRVASRAACRRCERELRTEVLQADGSAGCRLVRQHILQRFFGMQPPSPERTPVAEPVESDDTRSTFQGSDMTRTQEPPTMEEVSRDRNSAPEVGPIVDRDTSANSTRAVAGDMTSPSTALEGDISDMGGGTDRVTTGSDELEAATRRLGYESSSTGHQRPTTDGDENLRRPSSKMGSLVPNIVLINGTETDAIRPSSPETPHLRGVTVSEQQQTAAGQPSWKSIATAGGHRLRDLKSQFCVGVEGVVMQPGLPGASGISDGTDGAASLHFDPATSAIYNSPSHASGPQQPGGATQTEFATIARQWKDQTTIQVVQSFMRESAEVSSSLRHEVEELRRIVQRQNTLIEDGLHHRAFRVQTQQALADIAQSVADTNAELIAIKGEVQRVGETARTSTIDRDRLAADAAAARFSAQEVLLKWADVERGLLHHDQAIKLLDQKALQLEGAQRRLEQLEKSVRMDVDVVQRRLLTAI